MDEEKKRVLALAVHVLASMVEYAVVMAVHYLKIMGDDSVSDQVHHGCISILAQLDAIEASAIFSDCRKRKKRARSLARKKLMDMNRSSVPRFSSQQNYERMFKMDARTFGWFCGQVAPYMEKMNTKYAYTKSIPVGKRVAIALFHLATGASYLTAAEKFSVSESTVFCCMTELCEILCTRFKHMVGYPRGPALKELMSRFEARSGLPLCAGAVGCMRLSIKRSTESQEIEHLNQEKVHTFVTQVVVDSSTRVLSLASGFSGAVKHMDALRRSTWPEKVQTGRLSTVPTSEIGCVSVPGYLVGGPSYRLKPWLMVPYSGENLKAVEHTFNKCLQETWGVVETTFSALRKWEILSGTSQVDLAAATYMIGAVCIIHNMLLGKVDPYMDGYQDEDFKLQTSLQDFLEPSEDEPAEGLELALNIRNALASHLMSR